VSRQRCLDALWNRKPGMQGEEEEEACLLSSPGTQQQEGPQGPGVLCTTQQNLITQLSAARPVGCRLPPALRAVLLALAGAVRCTWLQANPPSFWQLNSFWQPNTLQRNHAKEPRRESVWVPGMGHQRTLTPAREAVRVGSSHSTKNPQPQAVFDPVLGAVGCPALWAARDKILASSPLAGSVHGWMAVPCCHLVTLLSPSCHPARGHPHPLGDIPWAALRRGCAG
jgi:hypothetical protein